MDVSYPFDDQGGTREFDEVFHVSELFSDFQFRDTLFFRAGKQTINWGVGYFFSPADLLYIILRYLDARTKSFQNSPAQDVFQRIVTKQRKVGWPAPGSDAHENRVG